MAVNLTNKWLEHAFPDDEPEREELLAEAAQQRREEVRRDTYLELSGADLKIRRHTGKNADDGPNGKAAKERAIDDMAMLAIGSPAYEAAYNNELTFTIDGEEIEITQGELYENARERAEDLQEQIDAAKRRGASADEIARLQAELDATRDLVELTDPRNGEADPDAVADHIRQHPGLSDWARFEESSRSATVPLEQDEVLLHRMNRDTETEIELTDLTRSEASTSLAATIQDSPFEGVSVAPSQDFAAAAMPSAEDEAAPDEQAPTTPEKVPGFDLG